MILITFIAASLNLLLYIILYLGFIISSKLKFNSSYFPFVSVIIAARNEENNISKCIESLKNLKYPQELHEIIIVNDRSTDKTGDIIIQGIAGCNNFKLIDSSENISSKFPGKANSIDCGIKVSRGEIIMMTDADCEVPENWINETIKYYDNFTGMVCGFTRINDNNGFFAKIQSFDWLYLLSIAIGSSGINSTLSCIGNNLSFRKKIYDDIGGYKNIKYSVTEDLALMREIKKAGYKIKFPVNPLSVVITDECKTLYGLYSQKKRWFRGGTGIGILGYFVGILMYIINSIILTGFLFLPLYYYISFILIKFLSDTIIIYPAYIKLQFRGIFKYFFFFELYFMIYGLLLPFTFLAGYKVKWKNRNV